MVQNGWTWISLEWMVEMGSHHFLSHKWKNEFSSPWSLIRTHPFRSFPLLPFCLYFLRRRSRTFDERASRRENRVDSPRGRSSARLVHQEEGGEDLHQEEGVLHQDL